MKRAGIVLGLIALPVAWSAPLLQGPRLDGALRGGAVSYALVFDGGEWWRLLTAPWVHVDLTHLLANVALGGVFAWLCAGVLGPWRTALVWVVGGVASALASALWVEGISLGASGELIGTLGAAVAAALARRGAGWARSLLVAGMAITLAVSGLGSSVAHLAGLFTGVVLGLGLGRRAES